MEFDDPMNDRYVAPFDFEDDDFADANRIVLVIGKKEEIAAIEGRFHAAAQDDDNGALAACYHHQALPDHERRRDDHAEVEDLIVELKATV